MFASVALADNEAGLVVKMGKRSPNPLSRTTDAMLPSRLLLERFIVRAERWRHHPRVGRGRPVSARPTPAPRQPISVVAAAHQPPHTVISVIIAQHCISLDIAPTSVTVT